MNDSLYQSILPGFRAFSNEHHINYVPVIVLVMLTVSVRVLLCDR